MLWQYLTEVDFLQGDSNDEESLLRFALQFMVMECIAVWNHDLGLLCCDQRSAWVAVDRDHATATGLAGENSRKGVEALQQTDGKDAVNKALLDGKEKVRTVAPSQHAQGKHRRVGTGQG